MQRKDKIFNGKTLAILSGGGDTPAINSSIKNIKDRALLLGYKVYGIRSGWKGLLGDGDVVDLTNQSYNGQYGGTALLSSRTNPFPTKKNPENRTDQIIKNLKRYKIDVLVTIGGDDTNGAAKRLYEQEGVPVIGFPKTIDNDLRTHTIHNYKHQNIEAVLCPGFPTAALRVSEMVRSLRSTNESHQRIMVVEVMGRDAGWLTGSALFGGSELALIPECLMTKDKKEQFFELVQKRYNEKKNLIIAVSEGVRWWNDESKILDMVYASSETDEYGHKRFGGVSGVIASEISNKLGISARSQISGYYPRSGFCGEYDTLLTSTLADKVLDLLLREEYGKMPVMAKIVNKDEMQEYNTSSIDMGAIGNQPLQDIYYDSNGFTFTDAYTDFLSHIIGNPSLPVFGYQFEKVKPL
ncbi:MAG: 6-phosphofructokinase [Bacteroidales bacterium]|jgi:6-phosphofructokinase|nr:6-phosphofructokinase [Bacteroidales bacterium]MDD2687005.1 6-phosphofructokinase [Bacteroidales bacterium]MDD3330521.1 6-phosphofructokinase [Bacteroidales bacterium]MDD3690780.1 6-phosphofructokinase [Bacteroidales bacterium]MDD4044315.1 6-phosphofructokinase [Bacteroidales bacterium]